MDTERKGRMVDAGYDSPRITPHSLRHSAITIALQSGSTLQEVREFARHADISATQVYAHNIDRAALQCEEQITERIFGKEKKDL